MQVGDLAHEKQLGLSVFRVQRGTLLAGQSGLFNLLPSFFRYNYNHATPLPNYHSLPTRQNSNTKLQFICFYDFTKSSNQRGQCPHSHSF